MAKMKTKYEKQYHVKKGDLVEVIAGKEKGKRGEIIFVDKEKDRVFIKDLNLVVKAVRPNRNMPRGGFVQVEAGIHVSNVLLVCPKCNKGVRVGKKIVNGKKVRYCKKCGNIIDKV